MTVLFPDRFRIANPAGFDGLFNWDFLLPIFKPTKIAPMDIDAAIERKGKILLFETKDPGRDIPLGQRLTLERMVIYGNGNISLFVVYGKTDQSIEAMEEVHYARKKNHLIWTKKISCDAEYVYLRVSKWWIWANNESP